MFPFAELLTFVLFRLFQAFWNWPMIEHLCSFLYIFSNLWAYFKLGFTTYKKAWKDFTNLFCSLFMNNTGKKHCKGIDQLIQFPACYQSNQQRSLCLRKDDIDIFEWKRYRGLVAKINWVTKLIPYWYCCDNCFTIFKQKHTILDQFPQEINTGYWVTDK